MGRVKGKRAEGKRKEEEWEGRGGGVTRGKRKVVPSYIFDCYENLTSYQ
jgi:hypothetical protein